MERQNYQEMQCAKIAHYNCVVIRVGNHVLDHIDLDLRAAYEPSVKRKRKSYLKVTIYKKAARFMGSYEKN